MDKSPDAFRTISEVAEDLDVPQHVLRFWESKFTQVRPMKRGGGRRYYRPNDVELLRGIRHLLYGEGYTIRGVQKLIKERGVAAIADMAQTVAPAQPEVEPLPARELAVEPREPMLEAAGPAFDPGIRSPVAVSGRDYAPAAAGVAQSWADAPDTELETSLRAALTELMEAKRLLGSD
ncbi:DNA-binding transcriptional MerR regulator [Rhodoligotrophos appendicifer]|uniref:MerR family transcriptional regulator n=1 Tax=Rhodoligotrophos appendicifer TaxID=987056 RepID=UPI0011867250|nr:MerR family transcriptional regulator [Rhodoligotrophos appendicifer]